MIPPIHIVIFLVILSCAFCYLNPVRISHTSGFKNIMKDNDQNDNLINTSNINNIEEFGASLIKQRKKPLHDLLGLGPAEIAVTLVVGLVLFGPETLKSLSKDVGKAAAELKEIPKTFKEGMEEGAESAQVAKMKEIAAEKRQKRDASKDNDNNDDDDDDEVEDA